MEECGKAQVKGVIIVSAGFKETGRSRKSFRRKNIWKSAKKYGIRVIGPNCIGIHPPQK